MKSTGWRLTLFVHVFACILIPAANAAAQDSTSSGASNTADPPKTDPVTLPDKPNPQSQQNEARLPQTKRILGIIPNFRAVSTDEKLPPQTVKEKFIDATSDSFDYSSVVIPGILAASSMASKAYPEFHQGAAGYARYFWHSAVDQTSENYWVEFIVPTITREDTRYYTLGRGGFLKRTGYAFSRAIITRSDAGNETLNLGEIVGAGAAAGISNLYYPSRERSFSNTGQAWAVDVGIDALSLVGREFWPDINRKVFRGKE